MNISKLIKYLQEIQTEHGDLEVDLITEFEEQHEQPLGDVAVAVSNRKNTLSRVKLLPEGF